MPGSRTREEFDGALAELVGLNLRAVRYYEINYGDDAGSWDRGSVHNLDFGLDLAFGNELTFNVTWSGEFFQYGLDLRHGSLGALLGEHRSWDASAHPKWSPVIGASLLSARYWWSWVEIDQRRISYPQDLELSFAGGVRIFLTAGDYDERNNRMSSAADNVAVLFSTADAAKFQIGPFAPDASRA